jgi:hypothetical protein
LKTVWAFFCKNWVIFSKHLVTLKTVQKRKGTCFDHRHKIITATALVSFSGKKFKASFEFQNLENCHFSGEINLMISCSISSSCLSMHRTVTIT